MSLLPEEVTAGADLRVGLMVLLVRVARRARRAIDARRARRIVRPVACRAASVPPGAGADTMEPGKAPANVARPARRRRCGPVRPVLPVTRLARAVRIRAVVGLHARVRAGALLGMTRLARRSRRLDLPCVGPSPGCHGFAHPTTKPETALSAELAAARDAGAPSISGSELVDAGDGGNAGKAVDAGGAR